MEIKYAPIIIPTLCRAEHFIRCVESLKKNSWAKYTDIYIALDYPAKDSHWDGYNKICEYLEGDFTEFNGFYVERRPYNYGPGKNIRSLREKISLKYDCYIRTDDDAEFAPNFIEYMDKCLTYFEKDDDIVAITGYSYPVKWDVSEGSTLFKENFIVPMWGTGFWRDKYKVIEGQIRGGCLLDEFENANRTGAIDRMTKACYVDYINMALRNNAKQGLLCKTTDIAFRAYTSIYNKHVVAPVISKVRNWGFDGSGVYCDKIQLKEGGYAHNYCYTKQEIDNNTSFEFILDQKHANKENKKRLDTFDIRSRSTMLKASIQRYVCLILGKKLFLRMMKIIGK